VEHGQGEAHRDERDDREGDGRVGHEAVGLDSVLVVRHSVMCLRVLMRTRFCCCCC
jgi:hypothetical protein